ncbi:hypothetical protein B0T26DRAFT_751637 [Lasiosphaeria miniovina]|uniref:Uncharacterized protein n=1 Tax=Lasiosphaeria miniovina TaxID=1954250 RepID=A0AA40AKN6_9PEZI|nr:uncharacterized protein B0T26DRAFT_751637 [Lasiosphaeria miniovina]KAK0717602.1 hypothetical protein B0T26DRAFT_751637 [Lasiosphaeria miniovina]
MENCGWSLGMFFRVFGMFVRVFGMFVRVFGMFVRVFGLIPPESHEQPRTEDILHLSLLNIQSLTYISQHFTLDSCTRTLRLFRYPSICVLASSGGGYQKLIQSSRPRVTEDLYPARYSLHREVLLSLRFILGKTRGSRKLARKAILLMPREDRDPALKSLLQSNLDAIIAPSSGDATSRGITRQDFLTPWGEFPLLGERLLDIQRYNEQQRASSTKALIRDKLNPARWCSL